MERARWVAKGTLAVWLLCAGGNIAWAGDWPMWHFDRSRGSATTDELPAKLALHWKLQLPPNRPAWTEDQTKLQFDRSYEPVVMGQRLFVPSAVDDSVSAYDTRTGKLAWRFFADGPVRFAPIAQGTKVYFVSDDGHLYCLAAVDGSLVWKFRGGPSDAKVLGNLRLVSTWPARGGPVLADGVIYFAAGVWPFMGTFLHAVDAETGEAIWTNSGSGSDYLVQPHSSPAFAGVSPQGYLAVSGDVLIVPGGRSVPAGYDRRTGKFLHFLIGAGKKSGGFSVVAGWSWYATGDSLFRSIDGKELGQGAPAVVGKDAALRYASGELMAFRAAGEVQTKSTVDRLGLALQTTEIKFEKLWQSKAPNGFHRLFLQAGQRVYGAGEDGAIFAVDLPASPTAAAKLAWVATVEGDVWSMLAGDDRLLVVTEEGAIHCFGPADGAPAAPVNVAAASDAPPSVVSPETKARVAQIFDRTGVTEGYAVMLGAGDVPLLRQLAETTKLQWIVIDVDAARVAAAREQLHSLGLLGLRIAVHQGDIETFSLPPYLASLIVCQSPDAAALASGRDFARALFHALRPYGGQAVVHLTPAQQTSFSAAVKEAGLAGAEVSLADSDLILSRPGPLPGSAPWTHQSADVDNSLVSRDELVKAPLGLLWFGGPSNQEVLPRHGHGPTPQVVGGRLIIEGPNMLRAVDVYTGRLLWQRQLPEVGLYYDNTSHHPGANGIGSNYVSVADGVYVAYGPQCLRLDPATGETVSTFTLPADESGAKPIWGYVGVFEDVLLAGGSPVAPLTESRFGTADTIYARYAEGSRNLVALDRHTGKVLWTQRAVFSFRHNAIAAGGGKVFCIDSMTDERLAYLKRRGQAPQEPFRLLAIEARSGKLAWSSDKNVFGTWLSYSRDHDLLLEAGSRSRDRARDEVGAGMTVYKAASGEVVWHNSEGYGGPPLLHGDTIITQGGAVGLLTGQPKLRRHPLTGEEVAWDFIRNYGCNTVIGCQNLLTFRSAAAGFFDLAGDGGTGNLGGFRASCTSNLVPADGVLNAPDYTRTCTCSYQLQSSLALVHMPQAEMWTFQSTKWDGKPVARAGINFGAPGDRRAEGGTLWLDHPSVGGRSPDLPITVAGPQVEYYRYHASRVESGDLNWVASSGVRGLDAVRLTLASDKAAGPRKYTVRLYFAELEDVRPGQRVFSVWVQGKQLVKDLDLAALGARQTIVRELAGVEVGEELEVRLEKSGSELEPILSGIEVVQE